MVAAVVGAAGVAASLYNGSEARSAAQEASQVQVQDNSAAIAEQRRASEAAIAEQRAARESVTKLLQPWVSSGGTALSGQQDLLGVNGNPAQDFAISQIRNSPAFTSTKKVGEEAILQNASATGGLRGGNTQAALGQFDESLLSRLIDQQYARLSGVSSQGQNAAAGVGNVNTGTANSISGTLSATGSNVSGLITDSGAASAGGILGAARANATTVNGLVNGAGVIAGRFGQPTFNPAASYASNGAFQPYYTGYDSGGGPAYG